MTPLELLELARAKDIRLEVHGDRLTLDAPEGAVTPELRAELRANKPALIALLSPGRVVALKGGLVVPAPALQLALDLEARGIPLAVDADHQFIVPDKDRRLTAIDRAAIARWRHHLGALIEYRCPESELPQ